jgi:hypothetical protein
MRGRFVRDLEKSRQSDAGARHQLVRPKLERCSVQHRGLDRKVQEQEKGKLVGEPWHCCNPSLVVKCRERKEG